MTGTRLLQDGGETIDHDWEYYGLHSVWTKLDGPQDGSSSHSQVLLCFDFVDDMRSEIIKAFEASDGGHVAASPFGAHEVFLEPLISRYDAGTWRFRTPVRSYEQVCAPDIRHCDIFGVDLRSQRRLDVAGKAPKRLNMLARRYGNMHELERHIIQATETVKVALMTLQVMIRDHKTFANSLARQSSMDILDTEDNMERSLYLFSDLLAGLGERAKAFEARL